MVSPAKLYRIHSVPCKAVPFLPCTSPPGPTHLVGIIAKAPPQLKQGQPHQHRGCLGPPGKSHQQGFVSIIQATQAVQGISRQEAGSLILRIHLC